MNKIRAAILVLCFILPCFFGGIISGVNEANQIKMLNSKARIEAKRDSVKLELYNEVELYIKTFAPKSSLDPVLLVDKCLEHDFDICFALAQGHLESHFGTAGLATQTNSVWNVGSHIKKPYSSANASIEPYILLIKNNYVREGKTELDLLHNFVNKSGYRYAEAGYEEKLRKFVYKVKRTTEIDSIMQELEKYDVLIAELEIDENKY